MSFSLVTSKVQIQRHALALYNVQLGGTMLNQFVPPAGSSVDALANLFNSVYIGSVGNAATANVAAELVKNVGIVAGSNGLTATQVADAVAYVKTKLDAVTFDKRGAVVQQILNDYATLAGTSNPYAAAATAWNSSVDNAIVYAGNNAANAAPGTAGSNVFTLTPGVDTWVGGADNDTVNAIVDGTTNAVATTMTTLDSIDGGAGNDTLTLNVLNGNGAAGQAVTALPVISVKNVETANVRSAVDLTANVSTWTGLTGLNVTQGAAVSLTAANTTDVSVAGATGAVTLNGGASATVAAATATQAVTIGATTVGAGAVSVTHTNQTSGNIAIDGGTTVGVTASKATWGTVTVGQGGDATDQPSGAITVTTTGAAYAAADTAATRGAIQTTGGTTVTVTQTATSSSAAAATDTTNTGNGVTQSAVTVTGGKSTTAVTVSQSSAVSAVDAVAAVTGVKQVDTVTFIALAATESVTVGDLTFTAAKALTAAEVAAAFANLSAGATHGAAPAGNGIYSGTFGTYTTGAVTTANSASKVDATASTAAAGNTAITFSDTSTANIASANKTAGIAAVDAVTGKMDVAGGVVQVTDYGYADAAKADSITTATLSGYAATSFVKSDALATLSLANSAGSFAAWNNTATTLGLTLNNVTGAVSLVGANNAGKYTTLNVSTTGTKSATALTAAAVTALNVSGDVALDLSSSTLSALKTVTVTGAAGLTINASGTTVTAVDTSASTGKNVINVDATKATYTGGAGVDNVTLSAAAPTKAVSLGAGDDALTLAAGTTSATGALSGGEGTDTLVMAAADAVTASATTVFETKIDGFEKLSLAQATAAVSVNLANLDDIGYVISAGGASSLGGYVYNTISGTSVLGMWNAMTTGQSFTLLGRIVTATTDLTSAQVISAYTGTTVAGATVTGTLDSGVTVTSSGGGTSVTVAGAAISTFITYPDETSPLTLSNMTNAGTLELTGAATTSTVTMTDATGTADSFNIVTKVDAANVNFGTVAVAGVETVNIKATDSTPVDETTGDATISKATLTISDAAAKAVVVTGNSDLDLTAASTVLTSVNASALTGKLNFSTAVTAAEVTGGSAADSLTATGSGQKLNGGAGADKLVVTGDLAVLTGGAGNDTFNVADATTNVNSYATITDLASGDAIKFGAVAAKFLPAKVTLGDTAVFQDLANAAIANGSQGDVAWFQYGGNTFVVEHAQAGGVTFLNNSDVIVKITGLVDLSTASFSSDADTLYIA